MSKQKPEYTKKMIEACKRRIRQYEEMIDKGIVTRWFVSYGHKNCVICEALGEYDACVGCILEVRGKHCGTHKTVEDLETAIFQSKGKGLIKAAKARLAYLKRIFKKKGIIQ